MASSGVILKELLVKLGLDVDEAKFAKGQIAASILEGAVHKAVDVVKELGHAFVENLHETIQYGDRIHKLSQEVGVGEQALQEMAYAGELADVPLEDMSRSMGFLARKMNEAKQGSAEAGKALKGIPFKDASGNLIDVNEVMVSVADRFAEMPDGAEKTAMAMDLFGKSGKQMIPMLNKGSEELARMREEARDMGLVMSGDATEAAEEIEDNLRRLMLTTKGLWRQAIAPLLPAINELIVAFLEWKKQNAAKIIDAIKLSVGALVRGLKALLNLFNMVTGVSRQLLVVLGATGLYYAIQMLTAASIKAAFATARAWMAAAAPFLVIGALIAALILVFDDLKGYAEGKDSGFGRLVKWLDELKAKNPFSLWVQALDMVVTTIKDAIKFWSDWENQVKSSLNGIKDFAKDVGWKVLTFGQGGERRDVFGGVSEEQLQARVRASQARAEFRAPSNYVTSNNSPTTSSQVNQIGPIIQQPGQSGFDLAKQIAEAVPAVK